MDNNHLPFLRSWFLELNYRTKEHGNGPLFIKVKPVTSGNISINLVSQIVLPWQLYNKLLTELMQIISLIDKPAYHLERKFSVDF